MFASEHAHFGITECHGVHDPLTSIGQQGSSRERRPDGTPDRVWRAPRSASLQIVPHCEILPQGLSSNLPKVVQPLSGFPAPAAGRNGPEREIRIRRFGLRTKTFAAVSCLCGWQSRFRGLLVSGFPIGLLQYLPLAEHQQECLCRGFGSRSSVGRATDF